MKINIVGGGIAGLTTAIALKLKGFQVQIYEQAAEWKVVGAGIVLAPNALAVFEQLGILSKIVGAGLYLQKTQITDAKLIPIQQIANNGKTLAIHRAALHQILLEALNESDVVLNKCFSHFSYLEEEQVCIHFQDGTTAIGDGLVGADGINSKVRQQFWPKLSCRDSGLYCWRAVVDYDLPLPHQATLTEAWGGQARFGFVPFAEGKVYWFACYPSKNMADKKDNAVNFLLPLFAHFDPLIQKIIRTTKPEQIHQDQLVDLPQKKQLWHDYRLCLIGDAAHATTPNMGQGAGQAIEDAYVLACAMDKYDDMDIAFEQFQLVRQKKVDAIINTSWRLGQVAHWSNPLLMKFRNNLFRIIPQRFSKKQFAELSDISYIEQL